MKFKLAKQKISEAELETFENNYNYNNLPQSYRNIILQYNGGFPEKEYFMEGSVLFLPIKYGNFTLEKMIQNLQSSNRIDNLVQSYFPFCLFDKVNSLHICLEATNYGKIYLLDDEDELSEVCDSFEDFMNELTEEDY